MDKPTDQQSLLVEYAHELRKAINEVNKKYSNEEGEIPFGYLMYVADSTKLNAVYSGENSSGEVATVSNCNPVIVAVLGYLGLEASRESLDKLANHVGGVQ